MLAQNFKTADELDLPETHRDALIKTLVLMETGKLRFVDFHETGSPVRAETWEFSGLFNMASWANEHPCGTACCIGGTAEAIGGLKFFNYGGDALDQLFCPQCITGWADITVEQAARALRNYLTTGDSNWPDVIGHASA